jgi:hypothetical protein
MACLTNSSAQLKPGPLAVSDGRDACGTVQRSSVGFVATDIAGRIVGTFPTLTEAMRSLPAAVSSCAQLSPILCS